MLWKPENYPIVNSVFTSIVLRKSFVVYSTTSAEGFSLETSWIASDARVSILLMSCRFHVCVRVCMVCVCVCMYACVRVWGGVQLQLHKVITVLLTCSMLCSFSNREEFAIISSQSSALQLEYFCFNIPLYAKLEHALLILTTNHVAWIS